MLRHKCQPWMPTTTTTTGNQYFQFLFDLAYFLQLLQVRSGQVRPSLPKANAWDLWSVFYRPDDFPITQTPVSSNWIEADAF